MKTVFAAFIGILMSTTLFAQSPKDGFYAIIEKAATIPGNINYDVVKKLPEELRAIAAYYSAMQGSGCMADTCGLTSALGLGAQGSAEHQAIIQKGNEVQVRYKVMFYFHGKTSYLSSKNDLFEINGNIILVKRKAMWKS